MLLLNIIPNNPLEKSFASCFHNFMLCWLKGLSSRGRNASTRRHNNDSIELEIKIIPHTSHFELLTPMTPHAKKVATVLAMMLYTDF